MDQKKIVGAATVVGCLQHGAGICEQRVKGNPLRVALRAEDLSTSYLDDEFLLITLGSLLQVLPASSPLQRLLKFIRIRMQRLLDSDGSISSLWTFSIPSGLLRKPKKTSTSKCSSPGTVGRQIPHQYLSKREKTGGVAMRLDVDLMTLTCLASCCGRSGRTLTVLEFLTAHPVPSTIFVQRQALKILD